MRKNSDGQVELILENRQVLLIFFVIVALCGVFFSLGYIIGRNTFSPSVSATTAETPASGAAGKPSPMPPAAYMQQSSDPQATSTQDAPPSSTDLNFYQSVEENTPDAKLQPQQPVAGSATASKSAESSAAVLAPPPAGILVQVSALTRREDADSLVRLLKEKDLPVLVTSGTNDALYHVVVGPYPNEREAQEVRLLLEQDGFRPIVKR